MTSDIPTYDDLRSMLSAYAADPTKNWTPKELIAYVYPSLDPGAGWLYSNTAYLLSELIIERVTGNMYADEIRRRFINNPSIASPSQTRRRNRVAVSVWASARCTCRRWGAFGFTRA
jgi:hypothetical protein